MNPQEAYWREMGLWPRWVSRTSPPPQETLTATATSEMPLVPPTTLAPETHSLATLRQEVATCTRCDLHRQRQQAVFGLIHPGSPWMFIGEGPGAEEDARGLPFVGAAGQLLDRMLAALGLERGEQVSIANAVKCRPPHNRTPSDSECQSCRPYLEAQIHAVKPRILVLLGRVAAHTLLGGKESLGVLRQGSHHYQEIPVVVTWHPAYLLRTPTEKASAWADLCRARKLLTPTQPPIPNDGL
ncbi:MAG: uracil-DNA glycosylase [Ferrovum sp.]|nr:uracil-DNA glycosylase [Ferrovum sp.]NDU87062.1 uracil-DNA glycosylase [Ferrovum sp.]